MSKEHMKDHYGGEHRNGFNLAFFVLVAHNIGA